MADGNFVTLVSKDNDANATGNPIYTQLTDGTDLALVDSSGNLQVLVNNGAGASAVNIQDGGNIISIDDGAGSITVDGTVDVSSVIPGVGATNLGKAEDAVHTTGDVGVMALAVRSDSGALLAADGDYIPLSINASGELRVTAGSITTPSEVDDAAFTIGTDTVSPAGFLADETAPDSVDEGDIGLARMTLDRKQLFVLTDATVDSQRLEIDASGHMQVDIAAASVPVPVTDNAGSLTVDAVDLDIRDLNLTQDAVRISGNTSANSETNPIFVSTVNTAVSGSEVHDYNTVSALGSGASNNHDYTVMATTFLLKKVVFSASGKGKAEIRVGPVASLVTKAVVFIHPNTPTYEVEFNPPIEVPVTSTGTVRVIRTNRENQAQDMYSTIIGNDI